VVVMACDDEVIPLQERIETVADDADLEEVYNTERHLLYVACTAHATISLTSVDPASDFSMTSAPKILKSRLQSPVIPPKALLFHCPITANQLKTVICARNWDNFIKVD